MISRLCSIMTTVFHFWTSRSSISRSFCISEKWSPVVGSSSIYRVVPVDRLDRSNASLIRWDSPPDRVGADCPSVIYPSPTSDSTCTIRSIRGNAAKNIHASSIVIARTSAIFFHLNCTESVSLLYRVPRHDSHWTYTSGKKCISIFFIPSHSHISHRHPRVLNENLPGPNPLFPASTEAANTSRINVNTPVYVAMLECGVRHIGA
jgi:hypothetical protein